MLGLKNMLPVVRIGDGLQQRRKLLVLKSVLTVVVIKENSFEFRKPDEGDHNPHNSSDNRPSSHRSNEFSQLCFDCFTHRNRSKPFGRGGFGFWVFAVATTNNALLLWFPRRVSVQRLLTTSSDRRMDDGFDAPIKARLSRKADSFKTVL